MAGDDAQYLKWCRRQPCAQCGATNDITAHHHTKGRGRGQRASDREAFPLCLTCHSNFHGASGAFKKMDKAGRRAWQDEQLRTHRERYFGVVAVAAAKAYVNDDVLIDDPDLF